MLQREMESLDCNSKSTVTPWTYQTNWIIAHGSLESSVTVESSEDPIAEPDPDTTANNSPLILKPRGPYSGPCEIKICLKQKYEVAQIYVRSSARAYEIYYEKSPHSINEYLCTVRCGVAERDDKVLRTSCVEDITEEHGECLSGYATAETASSGGSTGTGEDDWVNIKVPGTGSSPASHKIGSNGLNNIQDLYEATAQISDSYPCLSLTIRLLSLQEKGHVYVDELYVFVNPVESTDSANETVLAGSSSQSSLMAMFMPTLLQLSKSSVSRAQDKCASDEVLKNGKMETASTIIDEIDHQQLVKPKELGKDTAETAVLQQHTSAKKHVETEIANDHQPSHLETAMEQLISRLSRVEDICLRFEEKMLKPIEKIEARLQQVENQLEKLAKSSHDFGFPRCTRISAPAFSGSESNSSSFYNDDLEKKGFSCNKMPDLTHEANFHPGLIISAPEFSYGEGDEDDDILEPLKDSSQVTPKKTLSVDDALAAALNGFLSTAVNPSEPIPSPSGLHGDVNEETTQYKGHDESCQIEIRESPAAENGNRDSSHYSQVLTIKAPDFTAEETCCEEQLNYAQSSLNLASVTENEKQGHGNETAPPSTENNGLFESADSCDFGRNESTGDFGSEPNDDSPSDSLMVGRTCLHDGHLDGSSKVNMIDTYFEGNTSGGHAAISNGSVPNSAKDSRDTSMHQISEETNFGKLATCKPDDQDAASEEFSGHEAETVSEVVQQIVAVGSFEDDAEHVPDLSHAAFLDFEFPILEVKFTSDVHMSIQSPLDVLLDGAAESNSESPPINIEEIESVSTNGGDTTDLSSTNSLLLDIGVSGADLEATTLSPSSLSSAEVAISLI